MAAPASTLAAQLASFNEETKAGTSRSERLAERLVSKEEFVAAYAYDHAEEELIWIAGEFEAAAVRMRTLARYTTTGAAREALA